MFLESAFIAHHITASMKILQTKCKTCGAIFGTKDELVKHNKTHGITQSKDKSDSDHSCSCCFE